MSPAGWRMLSAVALVVLAAQCAPMLRGTFTCDGVQVLSQELTLADADAYCRYGVRERQKVEEYWGPTWTEPIRIHVSSEYRISRALVPAYQGNRGFLEMPSRRFQDKTGALLHEIVHIYAPHQNRFLDEGLAGSFVGFLVERYGLAQFRSLYATESYETAYGKPFAALEREWRSSLSE
jgi:hypothetical protein